MTHGYTLSIVWDPYRSRYCVIDLETGETPDFASMYDRLQITDIITDLLVAAHDQLDSHIENVAEWAVIQAGFELETMGRSDK